MASSFRAAVDNHVPGAGLSTLQRIERLYRDERNLKPALHDYHSTSSIDPKIVRSELLPDFLTIEDCLGRALCESRWEGDLNRPDCHAHEEITLYVALRAVEALHANDPWWMEWSTSGSAFIDPAKHLIAGSVASSPAQVLRVEWMRTLFRAALCMPVGHLVSHTSWRVNREGMAWNPADEDLTDFERLEEGTVKVFRARSVLDARSVSHATCRRLFPGWRVRVPGVSLALCDFFSARPCVSNPLYRAWHTAMHYFFYERRYPRIPFWWVTAINYHFSRSQTYRPISCEIDASAGETDWTPPEHDSSSAEDRAVQAPVPDPSEAGSTEATPGPLDPEPPVFDPPPVVPHGQAARVVRAMESQNATQSRPNLSDLTRAGVRDVLDRRDAGLITVNCKGAVLQKHEGVLYLVYPLFFRQLADFLKRPAATAESLEAAFIADGLLRLNDGELYEHTFEIRPPGATRRLGKVRGVALSRLGTALLFPAASSLPDNDALVPLGSPREAAVG